MIAPRKCTVCGKEFVPSKYHPHQLVCSGADCQRLRQLQNQRSWRKKNPSYFRYKERKTPWEKKRSEYLRKWRMEHRDYFKLYRQSRAKKQKPADMDMDLSFSPQERPLDDSR